MLVRSRSLPLLALALAVGCSGGLSDDDAVALVRRYNERNIEAFRTGDARLTEELTGAEEGKRLLGLIGVRLDQGLVMDARILEFQVLGVERAQDAVLVHTAERWHWLDRRVGNGAQVGLDSYDRYRIRYRLERDGKRWVVADKEFEGEPEIGRPAEPWRGSARDLHGLPPASPKAGGEGKAP